jgi:primary-amine oxidase
VDDGELRWGPWRLRLSLHPVEGLVLHHVCYVDGDRVRPVVYRASLSEMIVPYGATGLNHWWKNAFDAGDSGIGKLAGRLERGCDCVGEVVYMDAASIDEDGNAFSLPSVICLHEEDYGILWRHRDIATGTSEVRRSRRMVVSCFATVGNYDYGFFWYLYLDGTIQAEVKMTGMILTQAIRPGERPLGTNPITAELAGPHHQHLFNFRLDMCVDGPRNSVHEIEAQRLPLGPDNPYGNAFVLRKTLLERESTAQRMAAPELARSWLISNEHSRNACGEPVAYRLVPTHPVALLAQEQAAVTARATFATRHLWVTPFAASERRAAGDFPNQHPGGAGLPAYVTADRSIVDTDVVLWHTLGVTHFCRPEDFPVMPCEYAGFLLKPAGFFDRNPGLDLAPPHVC